MQIRKATKHSNDLIVLRQCVVAVVVVVVVAR
jgi:hypothetical protein